MSYRFPYLHDLGGDCYRFYHWSQGPIPGVSKAKEFDGKHSIKQFLMSLDAPNYHWTELLNRLELNTGPQYAGSPVGQLWDVVGLIEERKLFIYRIPSPRALASTQGKTRFTKDAHSNWQFISPAGLEGTPQPIRGFANLEQAKAFLNDLSPAPEQLKALKRLSFGQHWNPAQPRTAIAQELVAGNLVVVEQPAVATPPKATQHSEILTEELFSPTANSATLGPHALESDEESEPGVEQRQQEEAPVCELKRFTLRCQHFGSRGYLLDALNAEPNHNGVHKAIQVLSQQDADADQINVAFGGFCGEGKASCPSITIKGDDIDKTVSESPYQFAVHPPKKEKEINSFTDFLRHHLIPDMNGIDYSTYTVSSTGCATVEKREAEVHVFPTCQWSGSAKLGYCYDSDVNNNKADGQKRAQWMLKADIKGNYGTKKWALSADNGEETDDYFPSLRSTLQGVSDRIESLVGYHGIDEEGNRTKPKLGKVDLTWPKVALSGDIALQEVKSRYNIGVGGRVALAMDPLIEANLTLDIVGWLLNVAPIGYREFLKEVRKRAANGVGTKNVNAAAVIAIDLTLGGGLKGELAWEKPAQKPWRGQASGQAKLTVGLKAEVRGEAKIFYVKVTVGMAASIRSASNESEGVGGIFNLKAVVAEGKPALDGYVQFTGAAIYYTYYAEVAKENVGSDDRAENRKNRRGGRLTSEDSSSPTYKEEKMKKLVDLLPAARFPKDPGRYTLDKIDL